MSGPVDGPPDPAGQVRREVERILAEGRAATERLRRELAQDRREAAASASQREARARSGVLGDDARLLQAEVDRGRTTWAAILEGADDSAAARRARAHMSAVLASLSDRGDGDARSRGRRGP